MKFAIFLSIFCSLNLQHLVAGPSFTALAKAPSSKEEQFYKITNGEALVNDSLIREFVIAKKHVTVSYKNATKKTISPKYTLRIYNRYGFLIASEDVSPSLIGGSPRLEPGDVGGDKFRIEWIDMKKVFQFTQITLPEDFLEAQWISVSGKK